MELPLTPRIKHSKPKPIPLHKVPKQPGVYGRILKILAMHHNLLLIGTHGVGKTKMILAAAKILGLSVKYFSASTMDPYADLAGIPVVSRKKKMVEFIHDSDLDKYNIFFFDELNRPHDDKVLNGLLEAVQFLRVQGRPFTNLVCCVAAMNPPNMDYQVEDVDPALLDRFHHYITVPFEYHTWFYADKFGKAVGATLVQWAKQLNSEKKKSVTPRRLEYIGDIIMKTDNDLEMLKTAVMNGILSDSDFNILHGRITSAIGLDSGKPVDNIDVQARSIVDKQLGVSSTAINDAINKLTEALST
jgi:hypothetical protein